MTRVGSQRHKGDIYIYIYILLDFILVVVSVVRYNLHAAFESICIRQTTLCIPHSLPGPMTVAMPAVILPRLMSWNPLLKLYSLFGLFYRRNTQTDRQTHAHTIKR